MTDNDGTPTDYVFNPAIVPENDEWKARWLYDREMRFNAQCETGYWGPDW